MKKPIIMGLAAAISLGSIFAAQAMTTYGPTKEGDTLWKLSHHHPAGVGRFQMMEAIQNLNPTAFKGDHENVLRTGVTLQIPTTKAEVMANQNTTPRGAAAASSSASTAPAAASGSTATPAPAAAASTPAPAAAAPTPAPATSANSAAN